MAAQNSSRSSLLTLTLPWYTRSSTETSALCRTPSTRTTAEGSGCCTKRRRSGAETAERTTRWQWTTRSCPRTGGASPGGTDPESLASANTPCW